MAPRGTLAVLEDTMDGKFTSLCFSLGHAGAEEKAIHQAEGEG